MCGAGLLVGAQYVSSVSVVVVEDLLCCRSCQLDTVHLIVPGVLEDA